MLILGIDTTTKTAAVAVVNFELPPSLSPGKPGGDTPLREGGFKILSEMQSCGGISHSENLMPMIDYNLKCAGVSLNDINLFAVAHGPGSFTGIRIGIATVKGLAFGSDVNNCIGVSSLFALAYNFYNFNTPLCHCGPDPQSHDILVLPAIDARRKQVYNAVFEKFKYIKNDRIITVGELESELNSEFPGRKVIFTGDGADMCYNEINFDGKIQAPEILKKPSAVSVCRAATAMRDNAVHPRILAPSYLIKTQAEREYNSKNG